MTDPELFARLDRLALLLAALFAVELLEFLDADVSGFGFALLALAVVGFALLWGRSVFGLLFGANA